MPSLLLITVANAVADLLKAKGIEARVVHKENFRGEEVVGIILPKRDCSLPPENTSRK